MMRTHRPLFALLTLLACGREAPAPRMPVVTLGDPPATYHGYFTPQALDSFGAARFGADLLAMREPSFEAMRLPAGATVTRVIFDPSFRHTVMVRLVRGPDGCLATTAVKAHDTLTWIATDTSGLGRPGPVIPGPVLRRDSVAVDPAECDAIDRDLTSAKEWGAVPWDRHVGFDGSTWLFERIDASGRRLLLRWAPEERHPDLWLAGRRILRAGRALPTEP